MGRIEKIYDAPAVNVPYREVIRPIQRMKNGKAAGVTTKWNS